jgi:cytochrome bd-type quinol oxidase subunit 2
VLAPGDILPVVSLALFLAALGSRFLVRLLASELSFRARVLMPGALSLSFALVGLLLAWLALRHPRRRAVARVAVFLNAVVVALSLLAIGVYQVLVAR